MKTLPKQSNELPTKAEWKASGFDVPDELCSAKPKHPSPSFTALGEAGPVAGFTPKKWVETWRTQVRNDGLGSLPDRNSLEIVYDCAGGGQMVVVGKHTGIDCLKRENADLIVEAVNSHATLLRQVSQLKAALEAAIEACDQGTLTAGVNCRTQGMALYQQFKSALAAVEGEAKP